jgi:hypothetical protein
MLVYLILSQRLQLVYINPNMKGFARGLFRKAGPRPAQARAEGDDDEAKTDHADTETKKPARGDDEDDEAQQLPVLLDRAYDLMAANLFQKAVNRGHVRQNGVDAVFLRKAKGDYV